MEIPEIIIQTVLAHYPNAQGIYLFGSCMTEDEWPESDIDIALLLPPLEAKLERSLAISDCALELSRSFDKDRSESVV